MIVANEQEIREYWEGNTCGSVHSDRERLTKRYFDEIEAQRYDAEPFIRSFARFDDCKDKQVLEVGVGAATDFVNFARAGARLTGIDLTTAAIDHARHRLDLEDLDAELVEGSAEHMPFDDNSFDIVYSWGVLHHAENPERTFKEVRRVLAPGGEARIMLYGRHSWVAYKYLILGFLKSIKYRERPRGLNGVIARWMESPGTRCYTPAEIVADFRAAGFTTVDVQGFLTPYDEKYIGPIARRIRRDWFLGVTAS